MVQVGNIFCTYWILDFDMIATARSIFPYVEFNNSKTLKYDNYYIRNNVELVKLIDMVNTAASCMYTNIFKFNATKRIRSCFTQRFGFLYTRFHSQADK